MFHDILDAKKARGDSNLASIRLRERLLVAIGHR